MNIRSSISGTTSFMNVMDLIEHDACTTDQMAARTGLTKESLLGRLEAMERMGLVERIDGSVKSCSRGCHGCGGPDRCEGGTAYRLTDKGRKMLK